MQKHTSYAVLLCWLFTLAPALAQHNHGGHGEQKSEPVRPPRVFLDKNPRIVQYQLDRLSNERLLLVERNTEDAKYRPVYMAILSRAGMSRQHREEALRGLVELNESDPVTELLKVLSDVDHQDRAQARVAGQLAELLLTQSPEALKRHLPRLEEATAGENPLLRAAGYAALVMADQDSAASRLAQGTPEKTLDYLAAVPLVPNRQKRSDLRAMVVECMAEPNSAEVRRAAVEALASIDAKQAETFRLVAPLVSEPSLRKAAVRTLLSIAEEHRDEPTSRQLAGLLVRHAESTPAEQRTSDEFIDAMQLADQLLGLLPLDTARGYRDRLRAVTVRVVRIRTVEEEMRYDTPYFAVEAGRPVQVILENDDLMPHNLVITAPEALREVAELGAQVGREGKAYVPDSQQVLHATELVQPRQQQRLTFTAPAEPGEYPYVCTFPRHWMRMYGVMVVTDDLDAWRQNPTEPKDPVGSNRSFVQSWRVDDLKGELDAGLRGRSLEIGQRLFDEATCSQCHKVRGEGGAVGPELTDVFQRWKGDRLGILREVLDPSHKIDPQYAVHVLVKRDGSILSGIVTAEDRDSVSVVANPEDPEPIVVSRSEIDEMVESSKSMMPKALLDRFTKDEIFELLSYLENVRRQREVPTSSDGRNEETADGG